MEGCICIGANLDDRQTPFIMFLFLTRNRSSTKCPLRVHIAGHGSFTGPTLGMGLL